MAGQVTLYLRHGQIAVAMDIELNTDTNAAEVGKINRYILSGDLLAGRVTKEFTRDTTTKVIAPPVIKKYWYHLDHLNSTKAMTNEAGTLEILYEYRAFGEQLKKLDGAGNDTGDEAKYSYGGKELDSETNLYYFNARYYDATTGRFINVDPIQDGTNWYVYCNNNPLNMVDPTGLAAGLVKFYLANFQGIEVDDFVDNQVAQIAIQTGIDMIDGVTDHYTKGLYGQAMGTLGNIMDLYAAGSTLFGYALKSEAVSQMTEFYSKMNNASSSLEGSLANLEASYWQLMHAYGTNLMAGGGGSQYMESSYIEFLDAFQQLYNEMKSNPEETFDFDSNPDFKMSKKVFNELQNKIEQENEEMRDEIMEKFYKEVESRKEYAERTKNEEN